MSKDMEFCHSQEIYPTNMENNYWILLLKQTRCTNNCFQKGVYKAAKATEKLPGDKISNEIVKPKLVSEESLREAEDIIILLKKGKNIE